MTALAESLPTDFQRPVSLDALPSVTQEGVQIDESTKRKLTLLNMLRHTLECDFLKIRTMSFEDDKVYFHALDGGCTALSKLLATRAKPHMDPAFSDSELAGIALSVLLAIEHLSLVGFYLSSVAVNNIFHTDKNSPFLGNFELFLMTKAEDSAGSIVPAIRSLAAIIYKLRFNADLDSSVEAALCGSDVPQLAHDPKMTTLLRRLLTFTGEEPLSVLQNLVMTTFAKTANELAGANMTDMQSRKLEFFKAVETGNLTVLQDLGASFAKSTDTDGNTALMIATKRMSLNVVKVLAPLEAGERHAVTGNTALHYAMMGKAASSLNSSTGAFGTLPAFDQFLLTQIVRTLGPYEGNIKNAAGELPITLGIANSYLDTIIQLLRQYSGDDLCILDNLIQSVQNSDLISTYFNLNQCGKVDANGNTALAYAIASKNLPCIRLLLSEKNIPVASGVTPWQLAHDTGLTEILDELKQDYVTDADGNTQLHGAVMAGDIIRARSFLSLTRRKNNDGYTALMLAAALQHNDIVHLLKAYEAGELDNHGHTALHQCCLYARTAMAIILAEYEKTILTVVPIDVSLSDDLEKINPRLLDPGLSAAEIAFYTGNIELSKCLLLPEHTVASAPDKQGRTDLMKAVLANNPFKTFCHLDQAKLLDNDGFTALMYAAANGYKDCALLVVGLEAGATVQTLGRTVSALDLAVLGGALDVAEVIAEYELTVQNFGQYPSDMTQLMIAAAEGRPGLVWLYIDQVKSCDAKGWTALMYAVKAQDMECIQMLLEERSIVANDGTTAWYLAYKLQDEALMKTLRPSCVFNANGETPLQEFVRANAQQPRSDESRLGLPAYLHYYGAFNNEGYTALMLAAKLGLKDIWPELLDLEGGTIMPVGADQPANCASLLALDTGHVNAFKVIAPYELGHLHACGYTPLMVAAITGDVDAAIQHLSHKAKQNKAGWTALMYAVKYGHITIASILTSLEAGLINSAGEFATDIALYYASLDCAATVLRHEFQSYSNGLLSLSLLDYILDKPRETALEFLRALLCPTGSQPRDSMEVVRRIIYSHPDSVGITKAITQLEESAAKLRKYALHPAFEDEQGNTQLHVAAARGNMEEIRACVHFARLKNKQGQTALMLAVESNHLQCVPMLVDLEGGLFDVQDRLALDYALDNGHYDTARILLTCKEEFERATSRGFTPLMAAVIFNNINLIKENMCYCQSVYRERYTALRFAIEKRQAQFVELLKIEADIEFAEITAWKLATDLGLLEIAAMIKPETKLSNGLSQLQRAVLADDEGAVRELLYETGTLDCTGRTALILGIENRKTSAAKIVLPYEAGIPMTGSWNCGILTLDSPSPLLIATYLQNEEICHELLRAGKAGKGISICDKNGITPLMLAASTGNINLVELYMKSQIGASDRSGTTALMWAARFSQAAVVELLLSEAGRLNINDECALSFAIESRDLKSVALLLEKEARLLSRAFVQSVHDKDIRPLLMNLEGMQLSSSTIRSGSCSSSVGIKLPGRRSASTSLLQTAKVPSYAQSPTAVSLASSLSIKDSRRHDSAHPLKPSFIFSSEQ